MSNIGIRRIMATLLLAVPGMVLAMWAEPLLHPQLIGFGILFAIGMPALWLLSCPRGIE